MPNATWIFMRHFKKKPHPQLYTINKAREAALKPELARSLVERWDERDREEVGLSADGVSDAYKMCMKLPEYLRQQGISAERIIASPYQRTYESAQLIRKNCFTHVQIRLDERLMELKNGVRNLLPDDFGTVCELWPEYGRAAHEAFLEAAPPYGESHAAARDGRVHSFLTDLKRLTGGTLVVTHAGIIECVHQIAYGTSDKDVVQKFADRKSAQCGSLLICTYDRDHDRIVPVIDNICLHELS